MVFYGGLGKEISHVIVLTIVILLVLYLVLFTRKLNEIMHALWFMQNGLGMFCFSSLYHQDYSG